MKFKSKMHNAIQYVFSKGFNWEGGDRDNGTGVYLIAYIVGGTTVKWFHQFGECAEGGNFSITPDTVKLEAPVEYGLVTDAIKTHKPGMSWPTLQYDQPPYNRKAEPKRIKEDVIGNTVKIQVRTV